MPMYEHFGLTISMHFILCVHLLHFENALLSFVPNSRSRTSLMCRIRRTLQASSVIVSINSIIESNKPTWPTNQPIDHPNIHYTNIPTNLTPSHLPSRRLQATSHPSTPTIQSIQPSQPTQPTLPRPCKRLRPRFCSRRRTVSTLPCSPPVLGVVSSFPLMIHVLLAVAVAVTNGKAVAQAIPIANTRLI